MNENKNKNLSDDNLPINIRPSLLSMWFLFFGAMLGPFIVVFERDPHGSPAKWFVLSLFCLLVVIYRLGLKYTISSEYITCRHWYGLGREDRLTLSQVRLVRSAQGFSGRLVGCGHVEVSSAAADEAGISILGQLQPELLANFIESLAQRRRHAGEGQDGVN